MSPQESFHPIKKRDSLEEFNNIVTDNDGTTTPQSKGPLLIVCEDVDEMLHVEVADIIITQCFNTFEILENINSKSSSRSFDAFDLPYAVDLKSQDCTFDKVLGSVCSELIPSLNVTEAHRNQLKRNLSSFGLQIDEVCGGLCF